MAQNPTPPRWKDRDNVLKSQPLMVLDSNEARDIHDPGRRRLSSLQGLGLGVI